MITNENKGEISMDEERILQIRKDIKEYQETIDNMRGAIAEAERELMDEIERRNFE